MADLDDFFAKKDRKKSKGKKFATADEIAKKLEETGKRSEKLKKEKSQGGGNEVDEQGNTIPDEDEWKDFEEEKKDYTGLKIQNLTLGEEEDAGENSGAEEGGMEENEAGEMVPKKKQGPWRVVSSVEEPPPPPPQQQQQQAPVTKMEPQPANTTGSYVPPSRRNQVSNPLQPTPLRYANRMMKAAPDVHSEELFPSLSSVKTESSKKKREEGFEEVRNSKSHTARYDVQQMRGTGQRLALGNKFASLNHDQS